MASMPFFTIGVCIANSSSLLQRHPWRVAAIVRGAALAERKFVIGSILRFFVENVNTYSLKNSALPRQVSGGEREYAYTAPACFFRHFPL
jgi:hypothetical protein